MERNEAFRNLHIPNLLNGTGYRNEVQGKNWFLTSEIDLLSTGKPLPPGLQLMRDEKIPSPNEIFSPQKIQISAIRLRNTVLDRDMKYLGKFRDVVGIVESEKFQSSKQTPNKQQYKNIFKIVK